MEKEASTRVDEKWRESAEKFDYFMAGVAAALAGFLAPNLQTVGLRWSPGLLEALSLLAFVLSFAAAVWLLEVKLDGVQIGAKRLDLLEELQKIRPANREGVPLIHSGTGHVLSPEQARTLESNLQARVEGTLSVDSRLARRAAPLYWARYGFLFLGFGLLLAARVWKGTP